MPNLLKLIVSKYIKLIKLMQIFLIMQFIAMIWMILIKACLCWVKILMLAWIPPLNSKISCQPRVMVISTGTSELKGFFEDQHNEALNQNLALYYSGRYFNSKTSDRECNHHRGRKEQLSTKLPYSIILGL